MPSMLIGPARGLPGGRHSLGSASTGLWGTNDQFALDLRIKFMSADVRFEVQNRVSKETVQPRIKHYKNKVMQVT